MTQDRLISASLHEESVFANRVYTCAHLRASRRVIEFIIAVALIGAGGWLLYRNLIYGDVVSVTIALLAAVMVGSGTLILPTAIFGRRDW
jgi:hypothetical protein